MHNTAVDVKMEPSWKTVLEPEFSKPYFHQLTGFVREEYRRTTCYPPASLIFNAFWHTPFERVKVVILGQDPYHGPGQAMGLCFSVPEGVPFPPSLRNIYQELRTDLNLRMPSSGNLSPWADQGVLLLNSILTVRAGEAGSDAGKGWEQFTSAAIQAVNDQLSGVVFLLWGKYAIDKAALVDRRKHHILTAPHPSPLSASRGFFGCRHFSQTNALLEGQGKAPIDWQIP